MARRSRIDVKGFADKFETCLLGGANSGLLSRYLFQQGFLFWGFKANEKDFIFPLPEIYLVIY
jgi:hypothetical protein